MRTRVALIAPLLLASAAPADKPGAARERAKEVLKAARCDKCHDSTVTVEKPNALAVYDLAEAAWPARMSDARLPKLLGRLKSAPTADQKLVREFVAQELKRRAATRR